MAAETPLARAGLPEPPPWKKDPDEPLRDPGTLRLTGFYSKPELQKLNRNSIYIFVNKRLIRDRLLLHAITEAYRNVIPPTSFPVVLLFLEMPPEEVDVNVHPAKTEVRFRQQSLIHDFVRDSLRTALIKARPAAGFLAALDSAPAASPSLMPPAASPLPGAPGGPPPADSDPGAFQTAAGEAAPFQLTPRLPTPVPGKLPFEPGAASIRAGWGRPAGMGRGGGSALSARRPSTSAKAAPRVPGGTANGPSRGRGHSPGGGRTGGGQPEPTGLAAAARPAARVVHPGRRRRRLVDHRPACGPRAGAF